ncbi:GNAT family N-acetyltransferase [Mucilaginibacter pallidiroseus]|uniref:GNAT family N-acetyltransferase n=1 Tax=Mucilaginibacter pallidiroseus TaxID=2599295 RepID=A0A563U395_9SPHI|nr:GNAT family N-acetyltransferase [Mucilaginibacter pallidiroseus]TWR25792.1 GNAT family N-acetyltransferase [Mucilaginibacter pallidiroseus]
MPVSPATLSDVPELVNLVNSAYRGESSKQGWTTEANLIDGQRIDIENLTIQLNDPQATILKNTDEDGKITGCVYLQKRGNKMYLGMLTVSPSLQAKGLGRRLIAAAEEYTLKAGINTITMTVITSRHELLNWYERRGYQKTGEIIPLVIPQQFGILKQPLDMFILEKNV